ncbi:MAG TPA: flagellar hook-length control protein FliK [Intrasporangium sp.]|nr:flagellar hook-length control protein FliK [Intrasporangium sp.]
MAALHAPVAPASRGATSGSTAVAAVAVPPGFAAQLTRPMVSLAAGPPGEHVVTIRVTPENLGPVTVRAHIGADGVRIELFAPTDVGRAAVQAVLPDLRRDLAGTGLEASLDLSDRGAPPQDPSTAEDPGHRGGGARPDETGSGVAHLTSTSRRTGSAQLLSLTPSTRLDVLA